MKHWLTLVAILTLTACHKAEPIQISQAWVRAPAPGQVVAAAYMQIESNQAMVLSEVSSEVAQICEIHSMKLDQGIMRMRMLPQLPIPAQQSIVLAPGKTHIMLIDLNRELAVGQQVPLTLQFTRPDGSMIERKLNLPVKAE